MSDEIISPCDYTIAQAVEHSGEEMYIEFGRGGLKQDKITYNHKEIVNIYIVYKLESNLKSLDTTLENCLFGEVVITKHSIHIDKYQLCGYGIGYDSKGRFPHPSGGFGQNIIIVGANRLLLHMLTTEQEIF